MLPMNDLFCMHNSELKLMTLSLHKRRDANVEGDDANVERRERLTMATSSAWHSEKIGSFISAFAALNNIRCHIMYSLHVLSAFSHCMYSLYVLVVCILSLHVLTVCSHYTYSLH
jgi:hypothetical protein